MYNNIYISITSFTPTKDPKALHKLHWTHTTHRHLDARERVAASQHRGYDSGSGSSALVRDTGVSPPHPQLQEASWNFQ